MLFCLKLSHYARECYYNKNNDGDKGVAKFARDGIRDSEDVILMAARYLTLEKANVWYLDKCYSNHMIINKN